jgi:hypothetical protein
MADGVLITVKVEQDLREVFVLSCKQQDSSAAQELRKFMRDYVKKHGQQKLI